MAEAGLALHCLKQKKYSSVHFLFFIYLLSSAVPHSCCKRRNYFAIKTVARYFLFALNFQYLIKEIGINLVYKFGFLKAGFRL